MSGIRQKISQKFRETEQQQQGRSWLGIYWFFISELIKGAFRLLFARYYLRSFRQVGKMASVNGKPLIRNHGEVYLGECVRIWSSISQAKIFVDRGAVLRIGDNSRINGCHLSVSFELIIGKNVRIAPDVLILDNDFHNVDDHFTHGKRQSIIIEDDVWLASRCIILKGVRVGQGSVVAAGAVVSKDVPPYTVVAGVPAKVIKEIVNRHAEVNYQ
jgi:acetyltransferase-like isoleucine patch superfamily enzyme